MKEPIYLPLPKPIPSYYTVTDCMGQIIFTDPSYAICNSFIINKAIMGIRPKPVYPDPED